MPGPVVYDTAEYRNQPALARINVIPAYEAGALGDGVIVSVIDSGIDTDHPEFAGRIHPQSADLLIAGVVAPGDVRAGGPDLEDHDDHGTPVASIIGGARNGAGAHGVAPQAQLLIFRVDDDSTDEYSLLGSAIAEAVQRSATLGAGVVNMSFGTDEAAARAEFAFDLNFLKNNDVVTVLAAGNDSDANPDASALGALDVPGPPAAIISGSVDSSNAISTFSDRAGIAQDVYLAAPGEFLRGVVPGGGPSATRSFSGTSASTPVIAGAAALIRSRWPALSATEVVDILFASATDLGAPGTDAVYGRGLLNVGAAMSPIGGVSTSSISGSEVDPGELGASLSGVYGASLSSLGDIVVLDSYERDFRLPLSSLVAQADVERFNLETQSSPFDRHDHSVLKVNERWTAQLRYSARDQANHSLTSHLMAFSNHADLHHAGGRADLTDQSIGFALAGKLGSVSLTAAQGFAPAAIDRMTNTLHATPFLSRHAFADAYLPLSRDALTSHARFDLSATTSVDLLMSHGGDRDPYASPFIPDSLATDDADLFVTRAGVTYAFDAASLRYEQGVRQEQGAVFGAQFGGDVSATTVYSAIEAAWSPAPHWRLQGRIAAGLTYGGAYGFDEFAEAAPVLKTSQFSIAAQRTKLFSYADSLWIGVSQPLQVEAGALDLMLPTGFDQLTESLIFTPVSASLAPDGRRLDYEAGYRLFSGETGVIDVNLIHQTFQGFNLPAETAALLRGSFSF